MTSEKKLQNAEQEVRGAHFSDWQNIKMDAEYGMLNANCGMYSPKSEMINPRGSQQINRPLRRKLH
jgi:hypothetical protein